VARTPRAFKSRDLPRAGELHYVLSDTGIVVEGDVNGDGRSDFKIVLDNVSAVAKSDFIL
jgi:hypothetical protein